MKGNFHVRFGERGGETHHPQGWKVRPAPTLRVGGFIIETILNRRTNDKQDFLVEKKSIRSNVFYRGYDYDDLTIILAKANLLITLTELLAENPKMTHEFSELLSSIF
ncbi:MAG TPA: hypothetical protein VJ327_08325, partial [Patescibacteria group bacterium]|nr:hypothetical protein [Patescibacteria group bacterium]